MVKEREHLDKMSKNRQNEWYMTMLKKGTAQDKIAALTKVIQTNAMCSLSHLMQLVGMSKKANKKLAEYSIVALKDLYCQGWLVDIQNDGTIRDKLEVFSKNPVVVHKRADINDAELTTAYFTHCVREVLSTLINNILGKDMAHCDLDHYKMFALDMLSELISVADCTGLVETSIGIIVNKLGDASKKVQCHAIQVLVKMVIKHKSLMEDLPRIIVREIGLFLDRCSKPSHRIYSLGCLNKLSTIVVKQNVKIRQVFLQIYFRQFHKFVHLSGGPPKEEVKVKKDRTLSKEARIKAQKTAKKKAAMTKGDVSEEDNRVIELVLKGVNVLLVKSGLTTNAHKMIEML